MSFIKILICFLLFFNVHAQEVLYLKGSATQKVDGEVKDLKQGNTLLENATVVVNEDSLVILKFKNGSTLKLDGGSVVVIKEPVVEEGETLNRIEYLKGVLTMEFVKEEENETLLIQRNEFALGVRGTRFLIGEDGKDIITTVEKGSVSIIQTKEKDEEVVKAGESLVFENGKKLTKPSTFLWSKKLNWALRRGASSSGFKKGELRKKRRSEVRERIASLRKRKKKGLSNKMEGRLKRFKKVRKNLKNKVNKKINRRSEGKAQTQKNKRQKVQKFRQKMRKRGVLRRRRN